MVITASAPAYRLRPDCETVRDPKRWLTKHFLRGRIYKEREIQRVDLSATVGNPEGLLDWLTGHCTGRKEVVIETGGTVQADVLLDYTGNLENAALVISQLHRGQKRLVFCDSRRRVEELAVHLKGQGVNAFVSHSSLSLERRREAERAFAEGENCGRHPVILAGWSWDLLEIDWKKRRIR